MVIYCSGERGDPSYHQKCDAKRPCTTCVKKGSGDRCTYELRQLSHPTSSNFGLLSAPSPSLLTSPNSSSISPSFAPCKRSSKPTARLQWEFSPHVHNEIVPSPSLNVSVVQKIHCITDCVPRLIASSFTILPSIHFRTIPRPLRIPLSPIPLKHIQVSSVSENDLDTILCVFFRLQNFHRD